MRKALLAVAAASITLSAAFLAPALATFSAAAAHATAGHGFMRPDPWWNGG
jgi:hypothetical protein